MPPIIIISHLIVLRTKVIHTLETISELSSLWFIMSRTVLCSGAGLLLILSIALFDM